MILILDHPQVAFRDCNTCLRWFHDEVTGEIKYRHGKPLPRHSPPPCMRSEGCPKGHIDRQKSLSERNMKAWSHYLECKAVGQFPDDAIVRQNAAIISVIQDGRDRRMREELLRNMKHLVTALAR